MNDHQLNHATPAMRAWAQCLIAHESAADHSDHEMEMPPVFFVFGKLRPHLGLLIGRSGFNTLTARALALAIGEVACLQHIEIARDGSFKGLDELERRFGQTVAAEGAVVLLARLLGLLVTFIGHHLTARVMRDVWPELAPEKLRGSAKEVE